MPRVLGELTPMHQAVSLPEVTAPAALAMGLGALRPGLAPHLDLEAELHRSGTGTPLEEASPAPRELFPEEVALAALSWGLHARLVGQGTGVPYLDHLVEQGHEAGQLEAAFERARTQAGAAGLVRKQGEPTEAHVRTALSAGHPVLLLMDATHRREDGEHAPLWVLIAGLQGDQLLLHDPGKEAGPEHGAIARLPAVQGFQGTYAL
ncbi:MAG: peptidase C39 family protein, partial [Candidatus Thermoplasmatota archaeon]|nr:peptidase C39 family protein [Candidatus Thermoplasmatota archaeon]